MAHVRQLGFIAGFLISTWAYSLRFMEISQGELYLWIAPVIILSVSLYLAMRRTPQESTPFQNFVSGIKSALGVVVIAVVIYNIALYILLKWIRPGGSIPPFQAALLYSWTLLSLGMMLSLLIALLYRFRSPRRKT
jgi:hypothetical protein